jgi:hypothetical protein
MEGGGAKMSADFHLPSSVFRHRMGGTRLELVTSTMSTWRSNQLS